MGKYNVKLKLTKLVKFGQIEADSVEDAKAKAKEIFKSGNKDLQMTQTTLGEEWGAEEVMGESKNKEEKTSEGIVEGLKDMTHGGYNIIKIIKQVEDTRNEEGTMDSDKLLIQTDNDLTPFVVCTYTPKNDAFFWGHYFQTEEGALKYFAENVKEGKLPDMSKKPEDGIQTMLENETLDEEDYTVNVDSGNKEVQVTSTDDGGTQTTVVSKEGEEKEPEVTIDKPEGEEESTDTEVEVDSDDLTDEDEEKDEEALESKTERGKRDGSGPYKGSAMAGKKGMRKQAGEKCPVEDKADEAKVTGPKADKLEKPGKGDQKGSLPAKDTKKQSTIKQTGTDVTKQAKGITTTKRANTQPDTKVKNLKDKKNEGKLPDMTKKPEDGIQVMLESEKTELLYRTAVTMFNERVNNLTADKIQRMTGLTSPRMDIENGKIFLFCANDQGSLYGFQESKKEVSIEQAVTYIERLGMDIIESSAKGTRFAYAHSVIKAFKNKQ